MSHETELDHINTYAQPVSLSVMKEVAVKKNCVRNLKRPSLILFHFSTLKGITGEKPRECEQCGESINLFHVLLMPEKKPQ